MFICDKFKLLIRSKCFPFTCKNCFLSNFVSPVEQLLLHYNLSIGYYDLKQVQLCGQLVNCIYLKVKLLKINLSKVYIFYLSYVNLFLYIIQLYGCLFERERTHDSCSFCCVLVYNGIWLYFACLHILINTYFFLNDLYAYI